MVSSSADELTNLAADQRQKVEQKPEYFLQMCLDLGVVPNIWALHEWRNWLTPVFYKVSEPPAKPKRFNTMFYVCCVECDSSPQTLVDEYETMQAEVSFIMVLCFVQFKYNYMSNIQLTNGCVTTCTHFLHIFPILSSLYFSTFLDLNDV